MLCRATWSSMNNSLPPPSPPGKLSCETNAQARIRYQSFLPYGDPGVRGIWGEWLFIFRELGSNGNYFQGFGEQAHSFGDLGSPAKSKNKISP